MSYPDRIVNAPTDIAGCCVLWLDAQDLFSITKDGSNLVSQWSDKSGNAAHAVQATPANQPTYSATGFGGLPGINWGAGEVGARRLVTPDLTYGTFTVFVVGSGIVGMTGYVYVHLTYSGVNAEYFASGAVAAAPQMYVRRGGVYSSRDVDVFADGRRRIATRFFGGLNANNGLRYDGCSASIAERTKADPGTATITGPIYIGNADLAVAPHKGVIAEFIIFNRMLSEGEMAQVERYLQKKWAIAPVRAITAPTDIADCKLWLDAAQGVTLVSGAVSQWNDQSGNANHAVQATAGSRPTVTAIGAFPAIRFDGTDDLLTLTSNITTSDVSVFIVGLMRGAPSNAYRQVVAVQNLAIYTTLGGVPNNDWGTYVGGNWTSGSPFGSALRVTTVTKTAGTPFWLSMRQNGVRQALAKGPSTDGKTANIGGDGVASQNADVDLCEVVIFSRALTDGEVKLVEQYLAKKYNLYAQRLITSPLEVSGCALWLDATDLLTITKDGSDVVSQWADKSGNAKHATQATPADRPTYNATGFGGYPCLDWGTGSVTTMRLITPNISIGPATVFIVLRANTNTVNYALMVGSISDYIHIIAGDQATAGYSIRVERGGVYAFRQYAAGWLRDGVRRCVSVSFNGVKQYQTHRNGVSMGNEGNNAGANLGVTPQNYPVYVGNTDGTWYGNNAFGGVIAEVILFNRCLSDGERTMVDRYLADKYALNPG